MTDQSGLILPEQLTGPRSYFTDFDPFDSTMSLVQVERNLKLQLLTKQRIVIAASSMYHQKDFKLISNNPGLTEALNESILIPAIRAEFVNPEGFFQEKNHFIVKTLQSTLFGDLQITVVGLKIR